MSMGAEFTIKDIGIGLCALTFEHVNTQCRFLITKSPAILNMIGIVFCPLIYRRLTRTAGGRIVSIPFICAGDRRRISSLADGIDREMVGRELAYDYSIIVKDHRSRMILPCLATLKEMGYPDDIYSTMIESIKKCMGDERNVFPHAQQEC